MAFYLFYIQQVVYDSLTK